jgi:hypothetical protein
VTRHDVGHVTTRTNTPPRSSSPRRQKKRSGKDYVHLELKPYLKNLVRRPKPRKEKKVRLGKKSTLAQAECASSLLKQNVLEKRHRVSEADRKTFRSGSKTLVE